MRKALAARFVAGLLIAGVAFVVLYPILGVALWIAFVATGGALLGFGVVTAASVGAHSGPHEPMVRMNPIVDVAVLRARYFVTLALGLIGGFMVVETFAFAPGTTAAISFALGIGVAAVAGAFYAARLRAPKQVVGLFRDRMQLVVWDALMLAFGAIGAWNVVQSQVFSTAAVKWLTLADGLGLMGVALGGLILHELSTERVVHALEVVDSATEASEDEIEPGRVGAPAA